MILSLPAQLCTALRLDLRRWGLACLLALGPVAVLAAQVFDLWGAGDDGTRAWSLGLGVLELWLCLGVIVGGGAWGGASPRSAWREGLRVTAPGWGGGVLAEVLWGAVRALACATPALVTVLVVYMYRGAGSALPLAPGLAALVLHAVGLSAVGLALRRWMPGPSWVLPLLAAEILAHALRVPALRALLPLPVTPSGPDLAGGLAALCAAAGWTLFTAAHPPEGGRI